MHINIRDINFHRRRVGRRDVRALGLLHPAQESVSFPPSTLTRRLVSTLRESRLGFQSRPVFQGWGTSTLNRLFSDRDADKWIYIYNYPADALSTSYSASASRIRKEKRVREREMTTWEKEWKTQAGRPLTRAAYIRIRLIYCWMVDPIRSYGTQTPWVAWPDTWLVSRRVHYNALVRFP